MASDDAQREQDNLSPEEIGQYRATAQQNSMESIRAAEERYAKAKQSGAAALHDTKQTVSHALGATTAYAAAKTTEAKAAVAHRSHAATEYAADKGAHAKGAAMEKVRHGVEAAKETAAHAKDAAVEKARHGLEATKETAAHVKGKAKDMTVGAKGEDEHEAKDYTAAHAKEKAKGRRGEEDVAVKTEGRGGETTTMVGDVCEAVGAAVIGIIRTAKRIVTGEEVSEQAQESVVTEGRRKEAGSEEE